MKSFGFITPNGLSLAFSYLGHSYMHLFAAFYGVIVLGLEDAWSLPYADLLELWWLGSLMIGLAAIPCGWLGDRWSAPGMMAVMFIGMGAASIYCGTVDAPSALFIGLAALGLFAAIYHPVGVAWIVRSAKSRGKALGLNGIFGGLGVAASALVAGSLIDSFGWRAAFILPGIISLVTGALLVICLLTGWVQDSARDAAPEVQPNRREALRGFVLLLFTMFAVGVIFQTAQTALPKVFDLRLRDLLGEGTLGIGALVALVFTVGGVVQVIGGHLADRVDIKKLYVLGMALQVPMLLLVAHSFGLPLILAAVFAILLNGAVLPAENMLLARFTPSNRRGLAYGLKFVLAFSTAPLAIKAIAWLQSTTGEFVWVFWIMAGFAVAAMIVAFFIPMEISQEEANLKAQPAE